MKRASMDSLNKMALEAMGRFFNGRQMEDGEKRGAFLGGYRAGASDAPRVMALRRTESMTKARRSEIASNAGKAGGRGRGKKDKNNP